MLRVPSPLSSELEDLVRRVIGSAINVHKALGPGYVEGIYHDAVGIELDHQGIGYERELSVTVTYREKPLRSQKIDLLIEKQIVVELKAIERLDKIHQAQILSYMKATQVRVGLLMNFNVEYLPQALRRFVL